MKQSTRSAWLFTAGIMLLAAIFLLSVCLGSVRIPLSEMAEALKPDGDASPYRSILLTIRLPRTLGALISGASLAVAGLMMQIFFRNPIAEPYILGISSGANAFAGLTENSYTAEALFERLQDAEVLIYTATPTMTPGLAAIEEQFPLITECAAYESGRIYQQSDAYWTSIDRTDVLAGDLAAILHPELFGDRELTYFVKVQ